MTTIQKIKKARKELADADREEFERLACAIADGEEIKPEAILDTLAAVGRTEDELGARVEQIQSRREAAALILQLPELEEERRQKNADLKAFQEETEAIIEDREQTLKEKRKAYGAADLNRRVAMRARHQLPGCLRPDRREAWEELGKEIGQARTRLREAEEAHELARQPGNNKAERLRRLENHAAKLRRDIGGEAERYSYRMRRELSQVEQEISEQKELKQSEWLAQFQAEEEEAREELERLESRRSELLERWSK